MSAQGTPSPIYSGEDYHEVEVKNNAETRQNAMSSHTSSPQPNIAFTKAAFAFRDSLTNPQTKKVAQPTVTVTATPDTTAVDDPEADAEAAHAKRHKRRVTIARTAQHALTAILSIVIAGFQGSTYFKYEQTKGIKGAWPINADTTPTLLLFATGLVALFLDTCAIVAYLMPGSNIGRKAFALAIRSNTMITTLKTTAYGFSAVVCKAGFSTGVSSRTTDNTQLWPWACKCAADAKTDPSMAKLASQTNAAFNCTSNVRFPCDVDSIANFVQTVAWGLSLLNIAVQCIGVVIDQVHAADDRKFKNFIASDQAIAMTEKPEDARPLLTDAGSPGKIAKKGKYEKLSDSDYDQLDSISSDYDSQLAQQSPWQSGGQK